MSLSRDVWMLRMGEEEGGRKRGCSGQGECIHAGQFMSTRIHEREEEMSSDEDAEIDVVTSDTETESLAARDAKPAPPRPIAAEEKPVTFYKFGPKQTRSIAIDVSLGKLNKCINFAYKWKYFHGLKLSWKERLRLNNVIWRSWHMEFVGKQSPKYCCYSVPLEETHHQHSEAAVLEGMYWKRRLDAVCAQYKRWRLHKTPHYHNHGNGHGALASNRKPFRSRRHLSGSKSQSILAPDGATPSGPDLPDSCSNSSLQEGDIGIYIPKPPPIPKPIIGSSADTDSILGSGGQFYDKDDLDNYFTDRLFDSLNQTSYMFPDPKDLQVGAPGHSKNADFIQPSLITLQPSLEDIMASLGEDEDSFFTPEDNPFRPFEYPPFSADKGKGKWMRTKEEESGVGQRMGTTMPSSYTPKDYADAALLLPSDSDIPPLYSPPLSQQSLTYSQATSSAESGMGPPNPPGSHYPTPSKGALKAYPSPVVQDHPKFRAKRAKQRAREEMERQEPVKPNTIASTLSYSSVAAPDPSRHHNIPPSSAFTPVPQMTPYRPPASAPIAPSHTHHQPTASFIPFLSPQPNTFAQPLLVVKPSSSPVVSTLPSYPYIPHPQHPQLQLSPLPSPNSVASSSQSHSPVSSPQHQLTHILPNGPIKTEPMEQRSREPEQRNRKGGGKAGTKRAAADSTMDPSERKRMLHLHAEQSRRSALKSGFDQLEDMLPNLNPGSKNTNAAILARASEHIAGLKERVEADRTELADVQERVAQMKERIRLYQTEMPTGSSGGGVSLSSLAGSFVRRRTKEDWKFGLLWRLCAKLWASFVAEVEGKTRAELVATAREWALRHCNILQLRPEMSSMLVELATECPSVLGDPSSLPSAVLSLASRVQP